LVRNQQGGGSIPLAGSPIIFIKGLRKNLDPASARLTSCPPIGYP
jgi:hypothetical protein